MKTKIFSIFTILALLVFSCDLNEEPYGFYSEENFYTTPEDAEATLMYAYNALTFIEYSRGIFYIGELASETCNVKADEAYGSQQLNNWNADATNETLTYFFKYCYIAINRANTVIDNVIGSDFETSLKNHLLGEAYFLRAYNYFNLVRLYGLVPVQKEMVNSISKTSPNMAQNLDELYDLIISDLLEAESMLDINQKVGRGDKVAAQALLSKVYLTIASSKESGVPLYNEMDIDVSTAYEEAASWSHKVLYDQSQYHLDTDMLHIYDIDAPEGSEHIFIMSMDRTGLDEGNYSKIGMMFHPWVDGVPYYLKNPDGSYTYATNGWEVFQTTTSFYNSFAENDKRRSELMVTNVYNSSGDVAGSLGGKVKYPFTRKYVDPEFVGQKSSAKPYLIRFSEVALIYSEAVGATSDGYQWVNAIRSRAGLGDLEPGLSDSDFRDAVVQERAWELAFEGQRLYDLRRKSMVVEKDPNAAVAGITEDQAAYYPIPQKEIDLNVNVSN